MTGLLLPVGLGLLAFVEPCSLGATLVFATMLDGRPAAVQAAQVALFTLVRAAFLGGLGMAAALAGRGAFIAQRGAWIGLGLVYAALGVLLLVRRAGGLIPSLGPGMVWLSERRGAAALGLLFGLNIPACAVPLLAALLGAAADGTAGDPWAGFVPLAAFGLALSAPLVVLVLIPATRRGLDWVAGLSRRAPLAAGAILVALGLWSIGFGLIARLPGTP